MIQVSTRCNYPDSSDLVGSQFEMQFYKMAVHRNSRGQDEVYLKGVLDKDFWDGRGKDFVTAPPPSPSTCPMAEM